MALPSQPDSPEQQTDDLLSTQKLLRATLDSSMDMIQVFQAVRDQQGQIIDFTWILNNHASEKIYGDVVGKSLLQFQPGVVEAGIFAAFKQVVETGEPQQYEKQYRHEPFDGWFHQSVVKLDDGVATTTADISPRLREGEVRHQLALGAAQLGMFIWHVAQDRTEMNALARVHFGLPPDSTISMSEALVTSLHPEDAPRYVAAVASAIDPAPVHSTRSSA